jgi:hypothetical protein
MTRLTLALAIWIGCVSVGTASLTSRNDSAALTGAAPPVRAYQLSAQKLDQVIGPGDPVEFALTDRTEILLDGKPCKYADIPDHTSIIRMELAADQRTVLKIHFRTRK